MFDAIRNAASHVLSDIRRGRHLEAYTIFLLGLVLVVMGLSGFASERVLNSALLLAITFLVFHATTDRGGRQPALDTALRNREVLGPFSEVLARAGQLWVYAPTGMNVIVHAADIRRHVLARGGQVRVVVQDPESPAADMVRTQLDDSLDFYRTLDNSLATLHKMATWGDCRFRLLPFSPGFSMVIVNPSKPDGWLIVELHGFRDENIADRMHVRISRSNSLHWFDYWVARYEAIWAAGREPARASSRLGPEPSRDDTG